MHSRKDYVSGREFRTNKIVATMTVRFRDEWMLWKLGEMLRESRVEKKRKRSKYTEEQQN